MAFSTVFFQSVVTLLHLILFLHLGDGREIYLQRIPNGDAHERESSGIECAHLGHEGCVAGAARNQFGLDFAEAGRKWTKELCQKDSDGDGVTNGEELGDPCCEWAEAAPTDLRTDMLSHPGVAEEDGARAAAKCNNNVVGSNGPESESASPDNGEDGDPVCFPKGAVVTLESGKSVSMGELAVGDSVLVAEGVYSPVYMFTHRMSDVRAGFLRLSAGGKTLTLTPSHFVHSDKGTVEAAKVKVGNALFFAGGEKAIVESVEKVSDVGLYNPQTVHGDIVVNGLVVSTYTKAVVVPTTAHTLLTPFRAAYRVFGTGTSVFDDGVAAALRNGFACFARALSH